MHQFAGKYVYLLMLYIFNSTIDFWPCTNMAKYVNLLKLRYHKCMKTTFENKMYYYKNAQRGRFVASPKPLRSILYLIFKCDQSLAKECEGLQFEQITMQNFTSLIFLVLHRTKLLQKAFKLI